MSEALKNHVRNRWGGLAGIPLWPRCGLGMAVMSVLMAGSAHALPPTILVLSVAEEGRQQEALRKQVGELVQRAGARVAEASGLSSAARTCADPGCLEPLAKENRADYVLAARIERRSRHDRLIDMWLYGTQSGTDRSEQELCDVRDVKDCLSSLAGKLIGPQLGTNPGEEPAPTGTEAATAHTAPSKKTTPPPSRGMLPGWRLGLGIGLGVLAVGALGTAIGASGRHGQDGPSTGCTTMLPAEGCVYDLTIPLVTGYVAAGVFATGAALSFTLPMPRPARKEKP